MKGKFMLPLVLLAGLVAGGLGLYNSEYWDTWADKKAAFVIEIRDSLDPRAPEKARQVFADCVATQLLDLATKVGCKPGDGAVQPQVVACLKPAHSQEAAMALMGCIAQTQAELMKEQLAP